MDMSKENKIFGVLLALEEHQRMRQDRIEELSKYRMALRARNLVWLLRSESKDTDSVIKYLREVLSELK